MLPASSPIRQSGFSLIEILLTLGLIATLAVGAFVVYPRLQTSQSVSDAERKYISILGTTKEYFGDGSYSGLSNSMAISAGIASPSDLVTHWGTINLQPDASGFRVDFRTLPKNACQKLVSRLEPHSSGIRIGSTFVKNNSIAYNTLSAPSRCGSSQTVSFWPAIN